MPIEVVMSKSGRCRDTLLLPISRSGHPPSQDPSANTSHDIEDAGALDEGERIAVASTIRSDFIGHLGSKRPPPPNVERMMDFEKKNQTDSPKINCADLRMDLRALRGWNVLITKISERLEDQNSELHSQAEGFQILRDRHEHSINAVLNFLETFWDKEKLDLITATGSRWSGFEIK
ncbi:hypothetical protein CC86DRAFT_408157 [Ophiobolus disseminans]|uniref:Uncharacterized protein n=1 Tax=Ophiobolus disseminans TaxID=1469910 RepID=A0A6A6ZWC2_9PLEO|nr:hypothetical protein CC86DRAFT_408157 [Ophiobolus disseminans]